MPSLTDRRPPLPALVVGLAAVVAVMLLAFLTPAINSGASDLPLAVSAPPPALEQISGALEQINPGAFEITAVDGPESVTAAVEDRDAIGGLALGPDGVTVVTAGGAGAPYAAALRGIGGALEAQGQQVTYTDVAPLTAKDPFGVGLASLALPLIFGGLASGALFSQFVRSSAAKLAGVLGVSVLAGYTAALIVQTWFGAVEANYWLLGAVIALGIAAISATVLGLEAILGRAGIALAAVLLLFISNPLSGLTAGPDWLPAPWGAIGQFLPLGSASTALRSTAYFDGRGMTTALIVLAAWTVIGLALVFLTSGRRAQREPAPSPA